jgi:hypothetical protein
MVDSVMVRINTANLNQQLYAKINRLEYNKNILKDISLSGRNENNTILHLATKFKHGSPEDERMIILKNMPSMLTSLPTQEEILYSGLSLLR